MNWDDLRYALAVAEHGSLLAAARQLGVDHTTVGRRVEAAESSLGVHLFTRSRRGYALTSEGTRLLPSLRQVDAAARKVEREAHAQQADHTGLVRLTTPETFGSHYLAPRLAELVRAYPGLVVELDPAGAVFDLSKGEAEIGIRTFRTDEEGIVLRRAAVIGYGLYASKGYLDRHPVGPSVDLSQHTVLGIPPSTSEPEQAWLARLSPGARPALISPVSSALREAAREGAGVAVLPCYLAASVPELERIPAPDPPTETLWLTVHRDVRNIPRVRLVLDFLARVLARDADRLRGAG